MLALMPPSARHCLLDPTVLTIQKNRNIHLSLFGALSFLIKGEEDTIFGKSFGEC